MSEVGLEPPPVRTRRSMGVDGNINDESKGIDFQNFCAIMGIEEL